MSMYACVLRGILGVGAALGLSLIVASCLADEKTDSQAIATSGTFVFRLSNGKEITGYTIEEAAAKMILAGTELNVPLSLVDSMRFNAGSDGRVQVELSNGDSLKGQLLPGQFDVVADWGKAKINSSALSQITRVKADARSARPTASPSGEMVPAVRAEGTPVNVP